MIKHLPTTAHYRDAGFAPGSDNRIAARARRGDQMARNDIKRSQRCPVSKGMSAVSREDGLEPLLPKDFVAEATAKLEIHLARGHWSQAKATIDEIERAWAVKQMHMTGSGCEVLGWHVSQVFDVRTASMIERVCAGTIGALLECFPRDFLGVPNCGPLTIEKMARGLARIGAITAEQAQQRMEQYAAQIQSRDISSSARESLREALKRSNETHTP